MDVNTLAKSIVDQAIGDGPVKRRPSVTAQARGVARKNALSDERRSEIARAAAAKRWSKEKAEG